MLAEIAYPPHVGSADLSTSRPDYRLWLAGAAAAAAVGMAAAVVYLPIPAGWGHALEGPARLGTAAIIGVVVTAVQRRTSRTAAAPGVHHAQILLCVAGALMMTLINDSLARAFGIAGAASLVRFRTPLDDPRDAAVMFLLIGLGMASGLGAYTLAASGTVAIALFLAILTHVGTPTTRSLRVDFVADGDSFPDAHVQRVCARRGVALEVRELSYGETAKATYVATVPADLSLDALNNELMTGDGTARMRAIAWEPARKKLL